MEDIVDVDIGVLDLILKVPELAAGPVQASAIPLFHHNLVRVGRRDVLLGLARLDVVAGPAPDVIQPVSGRPDQHDGRHRQHDLAGMNRQFETLEDVRKAEQFAPVDVANLVSVVRHFVALSLSAESFARSADTTPI